jgi:hypothetical protein
MSAPVPSRPSRGPITVEPAALDALAAELAALAAELADDAERSESLAATFPLALGGEEGSAACATATAWASLQEVIADRARAVAGTLSGAAAAYRAEDATLSGRMGRGRPAGDREPR